MQNRTFVVTFFISFFLLAAAISLFNYSVDALCLYSRTRVVESVINDLLAGKIIAGQPNFQYRCFQKLMIEKRKEIPDTIAIGSSSSMTVRSSSLGIEQGSFFNHSVPCAVLNDYIAILGCYKKRGTFPETIILGIDPFVFDKKAGLGRWRPLFGNYYYLLGYIKGKTSRLNLFYELIKTKAIRAKRLLSYNYTSTNYHYFIDVRGRGYDYKVVKDTTVDDWLIIPDGSLYRPFSLRFQNDSTTREKVQRVLKKRTVVGGHKKISFKETFVDLIDYILESGTQIVFFLPPYHPLVYQAFKRQDPCIVVNIEEMLKSLAQSREIPVVGSYNPGNLNLSSKDFLDHVHARDYAVEKIFKGYQGVAHK